MELGNHPSCSRGAPVTLGWKPQHTHTRDFEMYEYTRVPRKTRKQLYMPVQTRAILLLKGGYTLEEIGNATHQVEVDRKHRADSLNSQSNWRHVRMMLEQTGKLNKGIMDMTGETLKMGGGLISKITKPVRKTVQARSA